MNKNLSWKELKALNDIYELRRTSAMIKSHPYIKYLFNEVGVIGYQLASTKIVIPYDGYDEFYESHFKDNYTHYKSFLENNNIKIDARRNLKEEDIKTLMMIYENKEELRNKLTNIEDFSSKLFSYGGGAKYLKNRKSVRESILKILNINEFPYEKKEHNWRMVVDYPKPKAVVLCENQSFLKHTWIPKKLEVKLWHVGGNNISILNDIDEVDLKKPIYYSCDWDLAGLQIYSRVKKILEERGASIRLLYPNAIDNSMPTDSYLHNSKWDSQKEISGLDRGNFSNEEISLIKKLIVTDSWIEEESNSLEQMLKDALKDASF